MPATAREKTQALDPFETLQVGVEWQREGRFEAAAEAYERILEVEPGNVDALHFLGVALHRMGRSQEGITTVSRALLLEPDCLPALDSLGKMLEESGHLDEAEVVFRRLAALHPEGGNALNSLGMLLKRGGNLEGAIEAFRAATARAPRHADAWHNLGKALRKAGRLDEAVKAYREAIQLRPNDARSYRNLAQLFYASGRPGDAVAIYEAWTKQDPASPIPVHMLGGSGGRPVPRRASNEYVESTFDSFAASFDAVLERLEYRAPPVVVAALSRTAQARGGAGRVLDAGCGTGLCGILLRPLAAELTGVDLSAGMLAKANARGVYDALVRADLETFLRERRGRFDAIAAADTLCYFGDLGPIFHAAAEAMSPRGRLVFTIELAEDDPVEGYRLEPSGRYSHGLDHVTRALVAARFATQAWERCPLRTEAGRPVAGLVVSAEAPRRGVHP